MTIRPFLCALAFTLTAPLISFAQTDAAPAAPAAPVAPAAPGAVAPVAPTDTVVAPADRPATYTIAQGDSLWTIAHKFGTTVVQLRKENNLKKGALLHPGQVIKLPAVKPEAAAK